MHEICEAKRLDLMNSWDMAKRTNFIKNKIQEGTDKLTGAIVASDVPNHSGPPKDFEVHSPTKINTTARQFYKSIDSSRPSVNYNILWGSSAPHHPEQTSYNRSFQDPKSVRNRLNGLTQSMPG